MNTRTLCGRLRFGRGRIDTGRAGSSKRHGTRRSAPVRGCGSTRYRDAFPRPRPASTAATYASASLTDTAPFIATVFGSPSSMKHHTRALPVFIDV